MPAGVFAVAGSDVVARVQALRRPAPRPSVWQLSLLLGLMALTVAAVAEAVRDTNLLFVTARAWESAGR